MVRYKVEDIRNIALVGHGAVGKTTVADLMLHKAGAAPKPGSVEDGTSLLDTEDEERQHKFTITSALAHFDHHGKRVNLLDTPGYPDFIGQVIGGLRAVENAVIVMSAASGIEVNTRRTFAKAREAGVARMVLVNKCDLENLDFETLIANLQDTFGSGCIPLNVPVGSGHDLTGVVSTLDLPDSIPAGVAMDPKAFNQALMDAIAEADEELMEKYLEGQKLSPEEISKGMKAALAAGSLVPVFFACPKTGIGVPEFMDALADYALAPSDLPRAAQNGSGEVTLKPSLDAPFVGQVFKTRIDPFVGKISYVRVYSGKLPKDSTVHSALTGKAIKVGALMEMQGAKHESLDEADAGDIVAIAKVDELTVGDTLTKGVDNLHLPPIDFPTPMIGLAVEPKSRADQQKISGALHKLEDEDQTFKVTREVQTHEMVIRGMSELHLQILREKLQHRDKVEVVTHQPKIPYRETCMGEAEGHYRHKKQTGGSGQFAEVHFRMAPIPQGINPEEYFTKERFTGLRSYHYDPELNSAFLDCVSGGSVPNNFIPAVEKGVKERMEQGVLAGYQVQDVACALFFGKDHPVDSNETAFKIAANRCFRDVFKQAKPVLLEPIMHVEITVPGDKLGDVTSDLNSRRGRMEGMDGAPGGFQIIHARAPLSEMMTYARALSSMTSGQGAFTLDFSHYEMVPANEQAKIVAAHQHEEEEA